MKQLQPRQFAVGVVILGLAGLIYSASIPLKRSGKTWDCQSNLKIIGLSMSQYNRDYDEQYPNNRDWATALRPYLVSDSRSVESTGFQQLMRCPATDGYYAFNVYFDRISMAQDKSPRASPLIFDIENGQLNQSTDGSNWPNPPIHTTLQTSGNNVLFGDGHVELRQNKPVFRKFAPRPTATPKPRIEVRKKP